MDMLPSQPSVVPCEHFLSSKETCTLHRNRVSRVLLESSNTCISWRDFEGPYC
ncbi:hypothetical protein BDZ97DRAFT_1808041 [Flammula alnicola]|nr:hypothetical protein BDZ97DRAFT_1844214 [Flammula alnicola]KAF8966469.1 hypothetical protein BDZ97DRAFT_1808041 [Flammula alnicola]